MRESNFTFPHQNRATVVITHMLYDRRALDTRSPLAILNNLTSLTYLTSTSPRIREILTTDGGLERLLDILRDSTLPRDYSSPPDFWGLNGAPTARVISVDRQVSLKHALAFQCVVNIGVRGSEAIRTRVVQAGALDLVAQILESWLRHHGISIFAGPVGSQAAVEAQEQGLPVPGTETRRRPRSGSARQDRRSSHGSSTTRASSLSQFIANLTNTRGGLIARFGNGHASRDEEGEQDDAEADVSRHGDTDVDMADAEGDGETDAASVGVDESMDIDEPSREDSEAPEPPGQATTPRASQLVLPMSIASRPQPRETVSQASSMAEGFAEGVDTGIPRTTSENNLASTSQNPRPAPLNLSAARVPQLIAQDPASTQSSPMGTPTRNENVEGRIGGRRDTIIARPINLHLAPRDERERENTAGSETSDGGADVDLESATIAANLAAVQAAQNLAGAGGIAETADGREVNVAEVPTVGQPEEPDAEALAAEQARLDMEAGAPPGQPGAAQTPRVPTVEAPTPTALLTQATLPPGVPPAQIIIANGAPRGFQDLGSYVGISSILNPEGDRYSEDSILLSLQLLAYLSKYPHVRHAFHHPREPMHPTFDLNPEHTLVKLPERPGVSQTPNIFSLVERFTFRPSPSDPLLFRIPQEIQYWAGVIMRNACRKDEARGGIRQCANMACGKWETFPREFAKCRRCRKAKYCSKECQSKAWQEGHRFWCNIRSDEPTPGASAAAGAGGAPPGGADDDDDDAAGGGGGAFPAVGIPRDILARAVQAQAAANGPEGAHRRHRALDQRGRQLDAGPTVEDVHRLLDADGRSTAGQRAGDTSLLPDGVQMDLLRETMRARDGHSRAASSHPSETRGSPFDTSASTTSLFSQGSGTGLFGTQPRTALPSPEHTRPPAQTSNSSRSVDRLATTTTAPTLSQPTHGGPSRAYIAAMSALLGAPASGVDPTQNRRGIR
ncbi:hypothetical protein EHS25_003050 [Saitozyma podzolica]|uniref:MYND-type domain-containing protein n=1 Tax=Saitozyma podzolica TaxID=1890683 RepID=A0A427YCM6_9TREE|nr:hypothetical protein EHS25_003050 [Saitozyma podzolica]